MLDQAGLAMVETNGQKWRSAYDAAQEAPAAPPPRRVLRTPPPLSDEPLVIVETRKN
jgi:hypothetical protein